MTGPYYADGWVTLFHADSRECTAWLEADVLVTDPPYGRGWKQGRLSGDGTLHPTWADDSHAGIAGDESTDLRDTILGLWGTDRPALVFGDLMLAPPAGTKQVLVYRKPTNAGIRGTIAGFRRDLEAVYLIGPWKAGLGGTSSLLATGARAQGSPGGLTGRYDHPHAKPVDVLETLLARTARGASIADPFVGTGSTLVAAKNVGRRAIGVELEERYCATAAARLGQDPLPFDEEAW